MPRHKNSDEHPCHFCICLPYVGTIQETKINRKGQYTMRKQNNFFKAIVLHPDPSPSFKLVINFKPDYLL